MTPRSSRQDATAAIDDLHPGHRAHNRAVRLSELSRSDLVHWPEAAEQECPLFRRYRRETGHDADIAKAT
jgi:hypothetical protein